MTWAEEEEAAKGQGCLQKGMGAAYVHFMHKCGKDYATMSNMVGPPPLAWVRRTDRGQEHEIRQTRLAMRRRSLYQGRQSEVG